MEIISRNRVLAAFLLAAICIASVSTAQTRTRRIQSPAATPQFAPAQSDTLARALPALDDVSRRMDSLQFIIVYNAELLQKDLERKVIWIYVMLGLMIVATVVLYGAFVQARNQRNIMKKELTDRLTDTFNDLDSKVKKLETLLREEKAPPKKEAPRRRRRH